MASTRDLSAEPVSGDLVRLERVTKVYRRDGAPTVALREVSLAVRRGEFLVIMGPSGTGKSTLLHLMGVLDVPTSGRIWFDGRDLGSLSDAERSALRRRRIGFVFQFFNLLPTLTVLENVCLPAHLDGAAGRSAEEVAARGRQLLEQVGLGHRLDRRPAELSGGELQRAAIARALFMRPALLLADEPTGNLDSRAGQEVLALIKGYQQGGQTVVVVTHDPKVAAYGDRVVHLKDGQVESITQLQPVAPGLAGKGGTL